jgi:pilus assembly protein CpaE
MGPADQIVKARVADRGAIKALVADDGGVNRALVEKLMSSDQPGMSLVDYVDLERDHLDTDGGGDVLLVACTQLTASVEQFIRGARERHPKRPIVLLSPRAPDGLVGQAFESGVDDLVTVPAEADSDVIDGAYRDVLFAVEKAVARKRGATDGGSETKARMICVLGLKGGCGKTFVSSNLGVALASAGRSVAVVDLDLQFGDVGLAMGLIPQTTLYDLMRSGGSIDAEKLDDFLTTHPSGARVLLSPVRPDQGGLLTPDFLRVVERVLQEMHEFVVIDTPPAFTSEVIGAVDASTDVLMVANRDSLALKNTKLGLETLERMEYDRSRVRLVLNRANSDVGIDREDLLAILGTDADVLLPSHRDITRSINRGEPIALDRRSEAGKAFHALAGLYLEDTSPRNGRVDSRGKRRRAALRRTR